MATIFIVLKQKRNKNDAFGLGNTYPSTDLQVMTQPV